MAPRYRRRKYRGSRDKYSVEQSAFNLELTSAATTVSQVVVPGVNLEGMRKVKHLTVSLQMTSAVGCWWALVYVPQGTTVNGLNITSGQPLYEPNQFVMNCGIIDADAGPIRFSSPLSRNLNSGDSIVLLLRPTSSVTTNAANGVVRYAITLQ